MMTVVECPDLPREPGTYAIVFEIPALTILCVGSLGEFSLEPGSYIYVGSAHGPGGLRARVCRHLRHDKRIRWHVDTLAAVLPVEHVIAVTGRAPMECAWVHLLLELPGVTAPIAHFGSGDCRAGCPAHLLRLPPGWGRERLDTILQQETTRVTAESPGRDLPWHPAHRP